MNIVSRLATAGLLAMLLPSLANAATVTFSSDGNFSNLTNCSPGCTQSANQLTFGGSPASWLKANDVSSTSISTPQNDFVIGSLTWFNAITYNGNSGPFNFDYTLTLKFTAPGNSQDTVAFHLQFQQPVNPTIDDIFHISNATLADLGPFTLPGVTVSDIHFKLKTGSGLYGTYDGSTWRNDEDKKSVLLIVADFNNAPAQQQGGVPEPSTWAMMILGFMGVGFVGYRRRFARVAVS